MAAVLTRPRWAELGQAFATFTPLPNGPTNTLLLLVASTIGAIVTRGWDFQQSAADEGITRRDLRHGRLDTAIGAVLAAVFGCGALIAGAALAGHHGRWLVPVVMIVLGVYIIGRSGLFAAVL